MKYTFDNFHAHLGLSGSKTCIVPTEVANNQREWDGKTFPVIVQCNENMYRTVRVRLIGEDYGLNTSGTGDMIVRPITRPFGKPITKNDINCGKNWRATPSCYEV